MKINPVVTIIALLFTALLFYVYRCCNTDMTLSITASGSAALLLISSMATGFDTGRNQTIIFRIVSTILLSISLLMNVVLAYFKATTPTIIVLNAIIVLLWLLVLNGTLNKN